MEHDGSYCFTVHALIRSRKDNQKSPESSTECTDQWESIMGGEWPWLSVAVAVSSSLGGLAAPNMYLYGANVWEERLQGFFLGSL